MIHTPEPWVQKRAVKATAAGIVDVTDIFGADGNRVLCNLTPHDRTRIVACVNACAGIPDPAAELARLRHRASDLEERLAQAARLLEMHLPIGAVRAVGLLEVPAGVEQLCTELTRLREVERAALVLLEGSLETEFDASEVTLTVIRRELEALESALKAAKGGAA